MKTVAERLAATYSSNGYSATATEIAPDMYLVEFNNGETFDSITLKATVLPRGGLNISRIRN